ncbi:MAG: hypothetical protein NTU59_10655, partial [Coprothermobacterota bacterium]|nr:hypothetical protein [Coprothermobacterota bacterium]
MQASSRFRKLHLFSVMFLLVFLLILSSFSTAGAQNGLCEQPMSSSTAGHPVQTSLAKSDPLHAAQPSGPLNPQAQAAVDAALASLEGNSSLSGSIDPATTSSDLWQSRSNLPSARGTHALAY